MLWIFFLFFTACQNDQPQETTWIFMRGREEPTPIYRMEIPKNWKPQEISENLTDSKLPLAKFKMGAVLITVHNFPHFNIPAEAQVSRWRGQIKEFDPYTEKIEPVHFSGYVGLHYFVENDERALLAYALSLDPLHKQKLKSTEKSAPVTIKAIGPKSEIRSLKTTIQNSCKTFELIEEIPR